MPGNIRARLRSLMRAKGTKALTLRGSAFTVLEMGTGQLLRLGSNLVLTRLLFPEAFGMMAIIQVFMTGLKMFSTTGTNLSIIRSKQGDDPDFLNTAWTIQLGRGVLLWLGACALALPAAALYDEPMLVQLMPVAGLSALIAGFQPTKVISAERHLRLGQKTVIQFVVQIFVISTMIGLAWATGSIWALVIGPLCGQLLRQSLMRRYLPGIRNRLRWDPASARELFHFGKFIFASTIFGFIVNHADRAIMGAFIPLSMLGVYTVAATFGALPFSISQTLTDRITLPLYRMRPIAESDSNRRKIFAVRRAVIAGGLFGNAVLAFFGVSLIELLYDDRYALAGPMLVLLCLAYVPRIVFVGAGTILLSQGDSRRFMYYVGALALTQTVFLVIGIQLFGVVGAILSHALAILVTSPLRIHYARRYEAWDWKGETGLLALGLGLALLACWLQRDALAGLF